MRFNGLDLNLLVTLDRLLTEKNISRAAEKLFLSQSATSGGLARLRDFFDDELLIPVGRNMALTPLATELSVAVRHALMQIEATIIKRPSLDLSTIKREIKIITSDYVGIAYLSKVISNIQKEAAGLSFNLMPPTPEPTAELSRGNVDFVVMPERFLTSVHPSTNIFVDTHAAVISKNNEFVGETLDIDKFMSLRQVTVRLADGPPNYDTAIANQYGNHREMDLVVSSFATVPFMLNGTNRVAIVYEKLAKIFCEMMPLRMLPSPVNLPPLKIGLQWHEFGENDKVIQFVKSRLLNQKSEFDKDNN